MEITFKSDTKHRKWHFDGGSFAHPAKMHQSLCLWLVDRYTKLGDVILDPMAGSGTLLLGCSLGRNVVLVELEDKFVKMCERNWERIQQIGPQMGCEMGWAAIIKGDARALPLDSADAVLMSPPFGGVEQFHDLAWIESERKRPHNPQQTQGGIGNFPYGQIDAIVTSPPYAIEKTSGGLNVKPGRKGQQRGRSPDSPSQAGAREGYGHSGGQIADLAYGQIDAIISSPPHGNRLSDVAVHDGDPQRMSYRQSIDTIITSPPYEAQIQGSGHDAAVKRIQQGKYKGLRPDVFLSPTNIAGSSYGDSYSKDPENIGNLKSDSYLAAMLQVYKECWRVLKPQGLLILVTKNFIRDKKEVRLDEDTIKLCEAAGFEFTERHYRKLTSQSFWRTIYAQKFPNAPVIDKEDVLVFQKEGLTLARGL